MKSFGTNDYGHRSFKLTADATIYSYLVADAAVENGVTYPASEAVSGGRGVIQQAGVSGQAYSLIQAGNTLVRKAVGAIAKGDLLTPSSTPGALRTAVPGESAVAEALAAAASADTYVPVSLLPGGGSLTVPRTKVLAASAVTEDGKLFTVPAGYRLDSLTAVNGTANAVTIKAGKTAGTQTIVAPVEVAASGVKDCTLLLHTFSLSADQDVYIASSDWNNSSLTIKAVVTYLL